MKPTDEQIGLQEEGKTHDINIYDDIGDLPDEIPQEYSDLGDFVTDTEDQEEKSHDS